MCDARNAPNRRLLNASFATFRSLPRNVDRDAPTDEVRMQLSNCSQSFRYQLKRLQRDVDATVEKLHRQSNSECDASSVQLENLYDVAYSMEKSWHICEMFAVNPTKLISTELIAWLKEICASENGPSLERLKNAIEPELADGYWHAVYERALLGDLALCREVLRLHSEVRDAPASTAAGAVTRGQCDALMEILSTHPFASLCEFPATQAPAVSNVATVAADFAHWQHRVRKLRQSGLPLLLRIPELDMLLRVLLGESSALEQCAERSSSGAWVWARVAIAQLLYVHPPPLGAADLARVLEGCFRSHPPAESEVEAGYVRSLREVMAGNVAPTLRAFYQLSKSSSTDAAPADRYSAALVPLLCTAHLTLVLCSSLGGEDLLIPLQDGPNETSFFEEVFLELAQTLAAIHTAPEVVAEYLSLCPQRGREYARVLLPNLCHRTDRSVRAVSALLSGTFGWTQEADALLRARGMWWLARNPAPECLNGRNKQEMLKASTLAKAVLFLQAARDFRAVCTVVEGSLSRCMHAVAGCSQAFPGLSIVPTPYGPYWQELAAAAGKRRTLGAEDEPLLELEAALIEADELLQTVDSSLAAGTVVGGPLQRCVQCLDCYTAAIQARFKDAAAVRVAVVQLASLVTAADGQQPVLPVRHWLHVLELVAWLSTSLPSEDSVGMDVEGVTNSGTPQCAVFTKAQAYDLLVAMQDLQSSYGHKVFVTQAGCNEGNGKLMRTLRLRLLGVVCKSLIGDNAQNLGASDFDRQQTSSRAGMLQSKGASGVIGHADLEVDHDQLLIREYLTGGGLTFL